MQLLCFLKYNSCPTSALFDLKLFQCLQTQFVGIQFIFLDEHCYLLLKTLNSSSSAFIRFSAQLKYFIVVFLTFSHRGSKLFAKFWPISN